MQRLYASNATAHDIRWHSEHEVEQGVMRHPLDSLSWKHFNQIHPDFAAESGNVILGLYNDGFQPFGQSGQQYSTWPVIVTPYNLPPWLCMKEQYMFLSILVPGPKKPERQVGCFLTASYSRVESFVGCWREYICISKKQNFMM